MGMMRDKKTRSAACHGLARAWVVGLAGLALWGTAPPLSAQPVEVPKTWGGDLESRPRLTGDWGGLRDELGKKGVVFDVDLNVTPQYVLHGGHSTGGDTGGNVDYTLNVDTGKLGLWPGGFFNVQADTGFGTNIFAKSGALVPVNTAAFFPAPNEHTTALVNATFMQFLSTKFAVVAGKFNTLTGGKQEFYGDPYTQFLNTAFVTPMTVDQVPLSAYGAGVIALPAQNIVLNLLALDPNGTATVNSFSNTYNNGAVIVGSAAVTIKPYGLVGHQNFSIAWNNKERLSLEQDPSNIAVYLLQTRFNLLGNPGPTLEQILARFFPELLVPAAPANHQTSSWAASYGFDQYLWQPAGDAKHGIGVFFSVGASDGNPNPIKWGFLAGVGGRGVPGRPEDSFGIGIARTQFSGAFIPFLRDELNLGLDHEDALEAYYNLAITGWLNVTADLQVIDPGLKRVLNSSGSGLMNVNTATIAGIRFRIRF
jgi:porin